MITYVKVNNFQEVPFVYTFIKDFEQTFFYKTVLLCRKNLSHFSNKTENQKGLSEND